MEIGITLGIIGIILGIIGIAVSLAGWIYPDVGPRLAPKARMTWFLASAVLLGCMAGMVLKLWHNSESAKVAAPESESNKRILPETQLQPKTPKTADLHPAIAPFDFEEFVKLRDSVPDDDVSSRQQFIHEWNNRTICWQVFVVDVLLDNNAQISLFTFSYAKGMKSNGRTVTLSRNQVPSKLLPSFDLLRIDDKIRLTGALVNIAVSWQTSVVPSSIERIK